MRASGKFLVWNSNQNIIIAMDCGATSGETTLETAKLKTSLNFHNTWTRNKDRWQSEFLIDQTKPELGSWLCGEWEQETLTFRALCKTCLQQYGRDVSHPWTMGKTSLQMAHAKKHEASLAHQRGLKKINHPNPEDVESENDLGGNRLLLEEALRRVWEQNHKGNNFSSMSSDETGSRNKCARLTTCLGQACKAKEQELLRKAWSIALHQDARQGVLCVRYAAASRDSSMVHRGVMGFIHNYGTKSTDLVEATESALIDFCTDPTGHLDEELYLHICLSVELLDSDGASDEQKTLRLLQVQLFPNARFLCRDVTHSARRLTKSPWTADQFLNEVMQTYILSSSSLTSTIQHSDDIRHTFGSLVRTCDDAEIRTVQNLGGSKDRFDSWSKPLSRFVLGFDSIWRTALSIQEKRKGTEPAQRANDFFRYVSVESLIQLAMLADAAFESMEVIRFHDTEEFDLSHTPGIIARFMHRCDVLFVRGEVLKVGHCKAMLQLLEEERTCIVDRALKSIGGPGSIRDEILQRCLARMSAWVKLAGERLDCEFPAWRPLMAFQIFDLEQQAAPRMKETMQGNIARLAELFAVDEEMLLEQFMLLKVNALHYMESGRCDKQVDAWQLARRHLDDRRLKIRYDTSVIPWSSKRPF